MKIISFSLVVASVVFTTSLDYSGRTDSNGGHNCTKTGTYHYH